MDGEHFVSPDEVLTSSDPGRQGGGALTIEKGGLVTPVLEPGQLGAAGIAALGAPALAGGEPPLVSPDRFMAELGGGVQFTATDEAGTVAPTLDPKSRLASLEGADLPLVVPSQVPQGG